MSTMTAPTDHMQDRTPESRLSQGAWLQVVPHLDPKFGGVSSAVPQLASALAAGCARSVALEAFCSPEEMHAALNADVAVHRWPASRLAWLRGRGLHERFRNEVTQAGGLHVHGLWEQSTAVAASTARSLRKPYILSAHGMLDRWALNNKRLKKAVYAALSERKNVQEATCLHALTQTEAADYRRFGATQPIAVIPNGVSVPAAIDAGLFYDLFPILREKRIVLFLSRLHHKKGLDILLEAWREVRSRHPEAHLVLAGPDFEGTRAGLERLVQEHGLAHSVLFAGMLDHDLKWSALRAAECFVLPSYSEGLSVATLEAMGCGVPVIITEQCNLPEVAQAGAGWTIQPDAPQLGSALREMLSHSAAVNRGIGENGRHLVETTFGWPLIARKMNEVYAWAEGGALPSSVELLRN